MDTIPFLIMLFTQLIVTSITVYFFWKVLKSPSKPEPDSFTENDPK